MICFTLLTHCDGVSTHLQLYALAGSASVPGATSMVNSAQLQLELVQPATSLLLTPLFTKRLCAVPLSEQLLAPGRMAPWQVGHRAASLHGSWLSATQGDGPAPHSGNSAWCNKPSAVWHRLLS
jgi:hypothetical protein